MAQLTQAEAFRCQADSDFSVFLLLQGHSSVAECHPLHYLQMATEKLAKAIRLRISDANHVGRTHASFDRLWFVLQRRDIGRS